VFSHAMDDPNRHALDDQPSVSSCPVGRACRAWRHRRPNLSLMTTYVAVFALVLGYLGLVAGVLALRTLGRLRRATTILGRGANGRESMLEAAERHIELTSAVADQLGALRTYLDATRAEMSSAVRARQAEAARSLRNVALVRYDAFDDISGRMSFSLALLDDEGDGVALSAITGRSDTRLYAKGVSDGTGEQELSPEEQQAVKAALKRRGAAREASETRQIAS
jgi:hypothetical protein